jgi:predicted GNAT family acetyltransferase
VGGRTIVLVKTRSPADPSSFLADAAPFLLLDEARHNLLLGIARTLEQDPRSYPSYRFWLVEEDGRTVAAAMQTPPFNLIVSRAERGGAIAALAGALHEEGVALPGVTAALPEVDEFAAAWEWRSGLERRPRMRQRIYSLERIRPVTGVRGRARPARAQDRPLLVSWVRAFVEESVGEASVRTPEETVDARLRDRIGGFALWEDEVPVSLAGWGGPTPNGIRIGPVYTPPERRRRGYASALTAAVSAEQLAAGRRFCFLYTDVANPTSNRIYSDIGYEPVCDSIDYAFEPRRVEGS